MGFDVKQFVKDRDHAFTEFVLHDDWRAIRNYCTTYCVAMPEDPNVMAAGIYKAVQEVTTIPDEVKRVAAVKCAILGFKPYMR